MTTFKEGHIIIEGCAKLFHRYIVEQRSYRFVRIFLFLLFRYISPLDIWLNTNDNENENGQTLFKFVSIVKYSR